MTDKTQPQSAGDGNPQFKITGLKTFIGNEGHGFNATLHINGKKAAFVIDDASGGDYDFHWFDPELRKLFADYVQSLPPYPSCLEGEPPIPHNFDTALGDIVSKHEIKTRLARLCRTKTLFRIKGETYRDGEWRTLKAPLNELTVSYLVKKYGTQLDTIYQP